MTFMNLNQSLFKAGFHYLTSYAVTPKDHDRSEHSFARLYTKSGKHIIVFSPITDTDEVASEKVRVKQVSYAKITKGKVAWDADSVLKFVV